MSKKEKLLKTLLSEPKDFRWEDLVVVLKMFGYEEQPTGKTGGSRRKFFNESRNPLYFHKPHPTGILKSYQIKQVLETLKKEELI